MNNAKQVMTIELQAALSQAQHRAVDLAKERDALAAQNAALLRALNDLYDAVDTDGRRAAYAQARAVLDAIVEQSSEEPAPAMLAALRTLTDSVARVDWDSLPQTTLDKLRSVRAAATNARATIAAAEGKQS